MFFYIITTKTDMREKAALLWEPYMTFEGLLAVSYPSGFEPNMSQILLCRFLTILQVPTDISLSS